MQTVIKQPEISCTELLVIVKPEIHVNRALGRFVQKSYVWKNNAGRRTTIPYESLYPGMTKTDLLRIYF